MFEIINEFENYDSLKKNKKDLETYKKTNNKFNIYIINKNKISSQVLLDKNEYNIIKYDDFNTELKSLYKSYKSKLEIENQFILDIQRSILFINGHLIKDYNKAINYLDYTYKYNYHNLLILCTQSIFASLLTWLYLSLPDNFYIGELDNKSPYRTKMLININNTSIEIKKNLRLFSFKKDNDIINKKILKISIYIDNYISTDTIDYEIELRNMNNS